MARWIEFYSLELNDSVCVELRKPFAIYDMAPLSAYTQALYRAARRLKKRHGLPLNSSTKRLQLHPHDWSN